MTRTRAWIEAQNAVTQAFLDEVPERESILARLTEVWNHERLVAKLAAEPFTDDDAKALSDLGI